MKLIILLFILPLYIFGQSTFVLPKDIETKGYVAAISEYIKALPKNDKNNYDTLFIGKHEDFPDIQLPKTIQTIPIVLLTNQEAEEKFKYRSSFIFINMIGDFDKTLSFFKLIVFKTEKTSEKNYWWPLHNFNTEFNFSINTKVFDKEKSDFEYPYSNKYADNK